MYHTISQKQAVVWKNTKFNYKKKVNKLEKGKWSRIIYGFPYVNHFIYHTNPLASLLP